MTLMVNELVENIDHNLLKYSWIPNKEGGSQTFTHKLLGHNSIHEVTNFELVSFFFF